MPRPAANKKFFVLLIGLAGLAGTVVASIVTTRHLISDIEWTNHTYEVLRSIAHLDHSIQHATNLRRGYAITGKLNETEFEQSLINGISRLHDLKQLTRDNPTQQEHLARLEAFVQERLANLRRGVQATKANDTALGAQMAEEGEVLTNNISAEISKLEQTELLLLVERKTRTLDRARVTLVLLAVVGVASVAMAAAMLAMIYREMVVRAAAENRASLNNELLIERVDELEQRNKDILLIGELSGALQACRQPAEMLDIIRATLEQAFPITCGAIALFRASRNTLHLDITWGEMGKLITDFQPDLCWALRRGRLHHCSGSDEGMRCRHLNTITQNDYVCVPLMAYGETLGVLTIVNTQTLYPNPAWRALMETLAETLAMGFANMSLRQKLMGQAISDPLTGLYNRRFMEEALELELAKMERGNHEVGVLVMDVDHFKRYNDTFGHQAGDLVLQKLAEFLRANVRGSDIACRAGGEEFVVLLPGSTLESTQARAEAICRKVHQLEISHQGRLLGSITISIGAAVAPLHATEMEALLHAADTALYKAKANGRDQVVVADLPEASIAPSEGA